MSGPVHGDRPCHQQLEVGQATRHVGRRRGEQLPHRPEAMDRSSRFEIDYFAARLGQVAGKRTTLIEQRVEACGTYQLTVNNSAVGATNVLAASYPGTVVGVSNYVTEVVAGNLDYLRFGYWYKYQPSEGVFTAAAWTAGYVTPSSDIPVQGTATFTGTATGLVSDYVACNCGDAFLSSFTGQAHVTANFALLSLTGSVDNIILSSPLGQARGPMNDIAFTATIDRLNNFFSGTTSVSSQPGGAWAFGPTANGHIKGRFYGRYAREIGAVFGLSEGSRRLIGSFSAKQP